MKKTSDTKNMEKEMQEVNLKSELYNDDNEMLEKREEPNDAVMWGFVIGFVLFFILLIIIVCFMR